MATATKNKKNRMPQTEGIAFSWRVGRKKAKQSSKAIGRSIYSI